MASINVIRLGLQGLTGNSPFPKELLARERDESEGSRRVQVEIESCTLCGTCGAHCPVDAVKSLKGRKEWVYDRMKCVRCGLCLEVCPQSCLSMAKEKTAVSRLASQEVRVRKTGVKKGEKNQSRNRKNGRNKSSSEEKDGSALKDE